MSLESLKNLPLLNTGTQPLDSTVASYYLNTFAGGSGPNGTYVITDLMGSVIGVPASAQLNSVATTLSAQYTAGNLSSLNAVIINMLKSLDGTYGNPVTGPVVIPSGPGAGTYNTGGEALDVLVPLASTAVGTCVTAMGPTVTASLNTAFNTICAAIVTQANNQKKAGVDINNLISGDRLTILGLVGQLQGAGLETEVGQSAQFFEQLANISTQTGQAIIGCMREGRNNVAMDAKGVGHDNVVPSTPTVGTQATLLNAQYTVPEARAFVKTIVSP